MLSSGYYSCRNQIKAGDIVLYSGNGFMSTCIKYFDDAHWNHVGMVEQIGDRLVTIEMWTKGIQLIPLSRRVASYKEFAVLRPIATQEEKAKGLLELIDCWDRDEEYDYWLLPRIAFYKKTGINLKALGKNKRNICSELAQKYTNAIGLSCYKDLLLPTPQDFIRHIDFKCMDFVVY